MSSGSPPDVPVDLPTLAGELLAQAACEHSQRAARTLPHPVDGLRQTVIALRGGAALHEHNSPGPAALLVLRARARLIAGEQAVTSTRTSTSRYHPAGTACTPTATPSSCSAWR